MDETIEKIIKLEYGMLDKVNNKGGRAWCQDHFDAFRIMRASQFLTWPEAVRESYLDDLETADAGGRNLIFEKYAWMMQYSHPDDFAKVEHVLPKFSPALVAKIEEIVAIQVGWAVEFDKKYPKVSGAGRPLHSSEDTPWDTSVETYARGEIATYSERTIDLYYQFIKGCQAGGRNLTTEVRTNQAKFQGWKSLDEVEAAEQRG
ncbi:MAG: DUF4125 family protein [Clostridiales bacterium]|nr:DUF4125 family protein [Clostridiales bacterium]